MWVLRKLLIPIGWKKNTEHIPILKNYKNLAAKLPKLQNAMQANTVFDFHNISSSYITEKDLLQLHGSNFPRIQSYITNQEYRLLSYLGTLDIISYLEGDILPKVDRATMQVALEGRDPMLDHKIIEFAMQLNDNFKMQPNSSKHLLRNVLYKYVPKDLIERPKQGFTIPVKHWLKNNLKEELNALKNDNDFIEQFGLNKEKLGILISNFLSEKGNINAHFVWILFHLHQWYLRWLA